MSIRNVVTLFLKHIRLAWYVYAKSFYCVSSRLI